MCKTELPVELWMHIYDIKQKLEYQEDEDQCRHQWKFQNVLDDIEDNYDAILSDFPILTDTFDEDYNETYNTLNKIGYFF